MTTNPQPALPPITALPWTSTMKPLASAKTGFDLLDDGRPLLTIEHDVVRGVTPDMLEHWFRNIEGELIIEGTRCTRYTAWHPRDHIAYRVHARTPNGTVGSGSVFHIHEALGRSPAFRVNVLTDVTKLDAEGFAHVPRLPLGLPVARMDYAFSAVRGGTRYVNSMTIGLAGGRLARAFNEHIRPRIFPDAQGRAWLLHNVEEVGNLEHFVPAIVKLANGDVSRVRTDEGYDVASVGAARGYDRAHGHGTTSA